MNNREQALKDFPRDVDHHVMTVLHDDGNIRHLRFKRPGSSSYWFDINTWDNMLVISGDMGCNVFSRIPDMFEFFRSDSGHGDGINPGYWAQKLQATSVFGGLKEFDEDRFNRAVMEYLVEWIRDHRSYTTKEDRRELWDAVVSGVVHADGDSMGARKQIACNDFTHVVNSRLRFQFVDFWERSFDDFTFHFYWCCYAIAWAVKQYDARKEAV